MQTLKMNWVSSDDSVYTVAKQKNFARNEYEIAYLIRWLFFLFFPNEERIDDELRILIIQQLKTKNKKTRNIGKREKTKNEWMDHKLIALKNMHELKSCVYI